MAYDKRYVGGGLNTDDALEAVPNGWVLFSKNMHLREGVLRQNVKGNSEVTNIDIPLSAFGTYTCIGAKEDPISNSVIYFLHHDQLDHRILQYNNKTNSIVTILQEQPGSPLNFSLTNLITGINIVYIDTNNPLLYWTDDFNRPRELNINAAKLFSTGDFTGYYSSPFLSNFIDAIKYPPLYPPTIAYGTDTSRITNNLLNKMFEFKYRYVFMDGQKSAFSPISETSIADQYSNLYLAVIADNLENNQLQVSGVQGASNVVKIELVARESNIGDFYLVATIDRSVATATDAPFTYNFYNDEVKLPIDINESIKLFDNLPQLAKAQEYIESNRIAYGNVVDGYDNVAVDTELTPVYNARAVASLVVPSPFPSMTYNIVDIVNPPAVGSENADVNDKDGFVGKYVINFGGYAPTIGDVLSIDFDYWYEMGWNIATGSANKTWTYPDFRAGGNNRKIMAKTMVRDAGGGVPETIGVILTRLTDYLNTTYSYLNPYYEALNDLVQTQNDLFDTQKIHNQGSGPEDRTQGNRMFRVNGFTIEMIDATHDPAQIDATEIAAATIAGAAALAAYIAYKGIQTNNINSSGLSNRSSVTRPTFNDYSSFKTGATHQFGIIYYDNANRSGGVNVDDGCVVNVEWYDTSSQKGKVDIGWKVKSVPPDWAVKWAWAYAGSSIADFHQTAVTGVITFKLFNGVTIYPHNADSYLLSYQEINDYIASVQTTNPIMGQEAGANLTYQWQKGDRVRLIGQTFTSFTAPTAYIDTEITGVMLIEGVNYLVIKQDANNTQFYGLYSMVEIYRNKIDSNVKLYYEFGEQYEIGNPGTATRYHKGEIQDQDPNQPSTVPATGTFVKGDIYFKERIVVGSFGTSVIYVEDYNWLDYANTNNYNKGRPNRILNQSNIRSRKQTMIPYSGRFIENTNINNLNSFFDTAFEEYEQKYGSIQRLSARDRSLICYQELKVGNIPVNERLVANANAPIVGQTDSVLNPIIYYAGEYGIGKNPESWARFGYADYFVDVYRGSILRLSINGIESISYLYKINDDITTLFGQISAQSARVNMFGVFNKRRMQYELAIQGAGGITSSTLAFDEKNNVFSGYFDYTPENMCAVNQDILSFKNGRAWLHEANALYNNFYGVQYNSEFWIVANIEPSTEKVFLAISEETSDVFTCEFTNNKGQLSNLIASDFVNNEGIYYAALLNDINTPNKNNPLLNGDSMRDVVLVAKLTNTNTSLVSIYAVNVNSTTSFRSNF